MLMVRLTHRHTSASAGWMPSGCISHGRQSWEPVPSAGDDGVPSYRPERTQIGAIEAALGSHGRCGLLRIEAEWRKRCAGAEAAGHFATETTVGSFNDAAGPRWIRD